MSANLISLDKIVQRQLNMKAWYKLVYDAHKETQDYLDDMLNTVPEYCKSSVDILYLEVSQSAAKNRSKDVKRFHEVLAKEYRKVCFEYALQNLKTCQKQPYKLIKQILSNRPGLFYYFITQRGDLKTIRQHVTDYQRERICCYLGLVKKCIDNVVAANCKTLSEKNLDMVTLAVLERSKMPFKKFFCVSWDEVCEPVRDGCLLMTGNFLLICLYFNLYLILINWGF